MFFWWICGGESGLPVLFLHHLRTASFAIILEPPKIKSVTVSTVSPSICHEVMGLNTMVLVFWMLSWEPGFSLSSFTFMHWRRKWQPTPVLFPGESQGQGSLVGCHLWGCRVGHNWSDLATTTSFRRQWVAFLGAWCPLPAFRSCFVEFTRRLNALLMNLWGEKVFSPSYSSAILAPPLHCIFLN